MPGFGGCRSRGVVLGRAKGFRASRPPGTAPKRREYVDLFLATTIGYGNMGWLINEFDPATPFGVEAMVRSYYMMQQLQQQYAFVPPKIIEYADREGNSSPPARLMPQGSSQILGCM